MNREIALPSTAKADRAALLRDALVQHARSEGLRGHVLRRLSQAVGRLPRPGTPRVLDPVTTLTTIMPSVTSRLARLGLGLAGGGGGSPGTGWTGDGLTP